MWWNLSDERLRLEIQQSLECKLNSDQVFLSSFFLFWLLIQRHLVKEHSTHSRTSPHSGKHIITIIIYSNDQMWNNTASNFVCLYFLFLSVVDVSIHFSLLFCIMLQLLRIYSNDQTETSLLTTCVSFVLSVFDMQFVLFWIVKFLLLS